MPPSRQTLDWVIFDADNTLWDLEKLYHDARRRFCRYMRRLGFDEDEVATRQQERDVQLFSTLGRRPNRFPQSFAETLLSLIPAASESQKLEVWNLGATVFVQQAPPYQGVKEALEALRNEAQIGVFTAGPAELKLKRLREFPYIDLFEGKYHIVDHKNADGLRDLVRHWRLNIERSWMIGDSLVSDIMPAQEVGLKTVWIQSDNWAPVETKGVDLDTIKTKTAATVYDAVNMILKDKA